MTPQPIPHDDDYEAVLIGSILTDTTLLPQVIDVLREQDFYGSKARRVWRSMVTLYNAGVEVSLLSVAAECGQEVESWELAAYCDGSISTRANIGPLVARLTELSRLRALIALCRRTEQRAHEHGADGAALVDDLQAEAAGLVTAGAGQTVYPWAEVVLRAMAYAEAVSSNPAAGISTGLRDLDVMVGGLHPGELTIVAGRPGMGKTAFAMGTVVAAARARRTCLVFTLEMTRTSLALRALCADAGISMYLLRAGRLPRADFPRLEEAALAHAGLPIYIWDAARLTSDNIRGVVRGLSVRTKIDLVVVDYIQLMDSDETHESRRLEVTELSRAGKQISKDFEVPVVMLSQLSRACETRIDKRPMLSDLRESGSIEQDADCVLFLYRDEIYNRETKAKGTAEIIIGKQRNGPTGFMLAAWQAQAMRFADLSTDGSWTDNF